MVQEVLEDYGVCARACVWVHKDIQGFSTKAGQGGASCFDVSINVLVLGQARLVRQRVVGEHGVVAGGAGAASVGEAGGILFCRGAQVQILLLKKKKREIHTVIARRERTKPKTGEQDLARAGTFHMVKTY